MDASTRKLVRDRAGDRCQYCRIHQDDEPFFPLHVEHIVAKQHRGSDDPQNLALSCHHDNDHKGPNLPTVVFRRNRNTCTTGLLVGENGPCKSWVLSIRDQCQAAGVPFSSNSGAAFARARRDGSSMGRRMRNCQKVVLSSQRSNESPLCGHANWLVTI